jgi:hypothetical protein
MNNVLAFNSVVFAKYVVHPEHSGKNGVATQPFPTEEAPDEHRT